MGVFSQEMRGVAKDLIKELGNKCTLEKITRGVYDPLTGETPETKVVMPTFSAPSSMFNRVWQQDGQNTNLAGFDDEAVVVAWFGHVIDETWTYDGAAISSVRPTMSQDDIIIFAISVHKGP